MIEKIIDNTKVIAYDPNTIDNIPRFFNEKLKECETDNILFIFEDLWNSAKSQDDVVKNYTNFITKYNIPCALYPYYGNFNKMNLNDYHKNFPKAELRCVTNDEKCNVLTAIACGMIILNKNKFNFFNITFNEQYNLFFYLFDILIKCAMNGMLPSFNFYIDLYNSWELFNEFTPTYNMNLQKIGEEKAKFFEDVVKNIQNDTTIHDINKFVDSIRNIQENI